MSVQFPDLPYENTALEPYIAGRKPRFVYFGGGTPSYLSVDQLQDLTDRMTTIRSNLMMLPPAPIRRCACRWPSARSTPSPA